MKRFYKMVTADGAQGAFEIRLDGKPVRTPSRKALTAPTMQLAQAIATEWAAQEKEIVPDAMPLTQILTTALDQVAESRDVMTHALMMYLNTDLICYRADNEVVAERQRVSWDPWLLWFDETFGVALAVTDRLRALTQPAEAQLAVREHIGAMDDARFAVLQMVTSLTGSLVLALALDAGKITPGDAFHAANIEEIYKGEIYQEDFYGQAPQQERREQDMKRDLKAAERFLSLLSSRTTP